MVDARTLTIMDKLILDGSVHTTNDIDLLSNDNAVFELSNDLNASIQAGNERVVVSASSATSHDADEPAMSEDYIATTEPNEGQEVVLLMRDGMDIGDRGMEQHSVELSCKNLKFVDGQLIDTATNFILSDVDIELQGEQVILQCAPSNDASPAAMTSAAAMASGVYEVMDSVDCTATLQNTDISDPCLDDKDEVTITPDGDDIFTGDDSASSGVNVLCDGSDVDVMTVDDGDTIATAAKSTATSITSSDSKKSMVTNIDEDAIITLDNKAESMLYAGSQGVCSTSSTKPPQLSTVVSTSPSTATTAAISVREKIGRSDSRSSRAARVHAVREQATLHDTKRTHVRERRYAIATQRTLNARRFDSAFRCTLRDLWLRNHLCDTVIMAKGGVVFTAHSAVLASSSAILGECLSTAKSGTTSHLLSLVGYTAEDLTLVLDFFYGRAPSTPKDWKRLNKLAMSLKIVGWEDPPTQGSTATQNMQKTGGTGPPIDSKSSMGPSGQDTNIAVRGDDTADESDDQQVDEIKMEHGYSVHRCSDRDESNNITIGSATRTTASTGTSTVVNSTRGASNTGAMSTSTISISNSITAKLSALHDIANISSVYSTDTCTDIKQCSTQLPRLVSIPNNLAGTKRVGGAVTPCVPIMPNNIVTVPMQGIANNVVSLALGKAMPTQHRKISAKLPEPAKATGCDITITTGGDTTTGDNSVGVARDMGHTIISDTLQERLHLPVNIRNAVPPLRKKPLLIKKRIGRKPRGDHKCKDCGRIFLTEHLMRQHRREEHPMGNATDENLKIDMVERFVGGVSASGSSTTNGSTPMDVVNIKHKKMWTCKLCEGTDAKIISFTNKNSWLRHQRASHTKEMPYICDKCGQSFYVHGELSRHQRIMHRAPKHACSLCGKRFRRAYDARAHLDTHSIMPLYQCDVCGAQLRSKSVLRTHIACKHNNERPFACPQCPKRFFRANMLKSHMCVHTGEYEYSCEKCSTKFSNKGGLKQHIKLQHMDDDPVCGAAVQQPPAIMLSNAAGETGNSNNNPSVIITPSDAMVANDRLDPNIIVNPIPIDSKNVLKISGNNVILPSTDFTNKKQFVLLESDVQQQLPATLPIMNADIAPGTAAQDITIETVQCPLCTASFLTTDTIALQSHIATMHTHIVLDVSDNTNPAVRAAAGNIDTNTTTGSLGIDDRTDNVNNIVIVPQGYILDETTGLSLQPLPSHI